jgi:disulfide bond formation protein DsbB
MMKILLNRRIGNLIGFLVCVALLAYGYYLQFAVGLEPCPLCILQRLALLAVGIVFLIAAIHHSARRLVAGIYGGTIAVFAVAGAGVAARHVWLQHIPEDLRPACGPGLEYLMSTFGPIGSLGRILRGSGECGKVDWTLLSFSIPEWTLAAFVALIVWAVFLSARD